MIDFTKQPERWRWDPYFSIKEFTCRGSNECNMNPDFMDLLVSLRKLYDAPLFVSSGYRSPTYNKTVSTTGENGPHTTGQAVDFIIEGVPAYKLLRIAFQLGFTGIGVSQKGTSRFVHLDNLLQPGYPRPRVWSY